MKLWLSTPRSLRRITYWGLCHPGRKLYGKVSFTQRLPFGLFLKWGFEQNIEREALSTIYVAMNTTIPVPTVLDVIEDGKFTLMLMTSLPGAEISGYIEDGEVPEEYFETTMRDWLGQLRALTPPTGSWQVCSVAGGPVKSFRVEPDPFGPFPDVASFHEKILRACPVVEWPRLEQIVSLSYAKPHRVCFSHGDLHMSNILFHEGRMSGLVDWECAGWFPEYWDYTMAIYHIKRLPYWVGTLGRISRSMGRSWRLRGRCGRLFVLGDNGG